MNTRRPILGNGEALTVPVTRKSGGGKKIPPKPYEKARADALLYVENLRSEIESIPEPLRFRDDLFYCLRMHPSALAKSYDMSSFLHRVSGISRIGTRAWRVGPDDITPTKALKERHTKGQTEFIGKTIFARSSVSALDRITAALNEPEGNLPDKFKLEICLLENINLLRPEERFMGFQNEWSSGKVELVLHPTSYVAEDLVEQLLGILDSAGAFDRSGFKSKTYASNIVFASLNADKDILRTIKSFNPLRAAHPLLMTDYPIVRDLGGSGIASPLPPEFTERSAIKVGIFDGGIKEDHPLLQPFCNEATNPCVASDRIDDAVAHGTAVAGAVLYGSLNQHPEGIPLPPPSVSVESFRVFPLQDTLDIDLYEAINLIESVIPARPDIDVYNLSFGPVGPILDDNISRFSYALDSLAHMYSTLFVVACGNDGHYPFPYNRIQAPSDIVNGLGVGAHDNLQKTMYSCSGPGREGAKTKPDVLAFGGSDNNPIHLVSLNPTSRLLSMGTSFSAPIVSGIAAQLIGLTDRITPLVARALIVHNADHPQNIRCIDYGHGCVCENVDEYLNCSEKTATILYQGAIEPATFMSLPIPLPVQLKGMVNLEWTIAIKSAVNDLDTLEYTSHCIEESFHPNSNVYTFTDPTKKKHWKRHLIEQRDEIEGLLSAGWIPSSLPSADGRQPGETEERLRSKNLKWDTVIRDGTSKRAGTLHEPMLVLHAMSRNENAEPVRYGAVVTISAPGYSGDIYNDIATHIPQLVPVRVKAQNEIRIRT